jgi:hypothetical protein
VRTSVDRMGPYLGLIEQRIRWIGDYCIVIVAVAFAIIVVVVLKSRACTETVIAQIVGRGDRRGEDQDRG